jgi:adenylyltransferase/sulfurtransferase
MKLTKDQRDRYSRSLKLRDFGEEEMITVTKTTVSMVGAGGIGSPTLRLLASMGFGKIRIIDGDKVDLSNLQRQNIYNTQDIGKSKARCAATNLSLMNPEVEYQAIDSAIEEGNVEKLLKESDIIVDGLDSFHTRRLVNHVCVKHGIPYVFAGAVEYYANLSTIIPGQTGCLHCVMGNAQDNPENTAAKIGVSPELLSVVAGIEARECLLLAIGRKPNLAGRLMTIDISTLSADFFEFARLENCPVCKALGTKE